MTQPTGHMVRVGQIYARTDRVEHIESRIRVTQYQPGADRAVVVDGFTEKRRREIGVAKLRPAGSSSSTVWRLVSESGVAERVRSYPEPDQTVWHRPAPGHLCDGQCDWHPIACSPEEGIVAPGPIEDVPVVLDGRPTQNWCPSCAPAGVSR